MPKLKFLQKYVVNFFIYTILLIMVIMLTYLDLILSPNYLLNRFQKADFYNNVTISIKDELANYVTQSGLDDTVLEGLVQEEVIEKIITESVLALYENKELKISSTDFRENLRTNIKKYLNNKSLEIDDENTLDLYVNMLTSTYEDELKIYRKIGSLNPLYLKLSKYYKLLLIGLILVLVIMVIIRRDSVFKRRNFLALPIASTALTLLLAYFYLKNMIYVENIFIYDKTVSALISSVYVDLTKRLLYNGLICLLIAILITIQKNLKPKKPKETNYLEKRII